MTERPEQGLGEERQLDIAFEAAFRNFAVDQEAGDVAAAAQFHAAVPEVGFDDDEGGETQLQTATLVAAPSTAILSIGDQVKDYQNNVWAVLGLDLSVSVSTYRLRREILSDSAYGIDRGGREK